MIIWICFPFTPPFSSFHLTHYHFPFLFSLFTLHQTILSSTITFDPASSRWTHAVVVSPDTVSTLLLLMLPLPFSLASSFSRFWSWCIPHVSLTVTWPSLSKLKIRLWCSLLLFSRKEMPLSRCLFVSPSWTICCFRTLLSMLLNCKWVPPLR